jgi:hypothetical protein
MLDPIDKNVHDPIRAAGGLLWRQPGKGFEVAIVHRNRYDDWTLPKGKRNIYTHDHHGANYDGSNFGHCYYTLPQFWNSHLSEPELFIPQGLFIWQE